MYPVVEITARDYEAGLGDPSSPATPSDWARILRTELEAKKAAKRTSKKEFNTARALALELLGNQTAIALFALKQFRDVADPGKACYQSFERVSRSLEEVVDLREIEETLRVRIHDFPTLNPVESLGIFAKPLREAGSGIIYGTQAIRPFYLRTAINERGEQLLSRAGTFAWHVHDGAFSSLLSDEGPAIALDRMAERAQDQGNPCLMNAVSRRAVERPQEVARQRQEVRRRREDLLRRRAVAAKQQSASRRREVDEQEKHLNDEAKRLAEREEQLAESKITKIDARATLERVDPQMIIESILSREWGNADERTRWRLGRQALLKERESGLAGCSIPFAKFSDKETMTQVELDEALANGRRNFAEVEASLYQRIRKHKVNRPGRPRLEAETEIEAMIDQMKVFTEKRLEMEFHFNILATWSVLRSPEFREAGPTPWLDTSPKISTTLRQLVEVLGSIVDTDVIGEPSDEHLDPRVPAARNRLRELLNLFKPAPDNLSLEDFLRTHGDNYFPKMAQRLSGRFDRTTLSDEQTVDTSWQLIEHLRDAVQLATRYCNVQQDALINKLSRAYQKPDFCIRRDALGRERDRLLPIDESWDEEWYHGPTRQEPSN
jgi:hypothetical protein